MPLPSALQLAAAQDPSVHPDPHASPSLIEKLTRQLTSEQQQCAQLRTQLLQESTRRSVPVSLPAWGGGGECEREGGRGKDAEDEAMLAQLRAQLVEERLGATKLRQELRSAEECWRIENEELETRVRVLTRAQQLTRARGREQAERVEVLERKLAAAEGEAREAARREVEVAQARAGERAAATIASSGGGERRRGRRGGEASSQHEPASPSEPQSRSRSHARDEVYHLAGVKRQLTDLYEELPSEIHLRHAPLAVKLQVMRAQLHAERREASAAVTALALALNESEEGMDVALRRAVLCERQAAEVRTG
ncbi:MAG: hypothetical protein SGPRY_007512 [Prymnesium sp.]